MTLKTAIIYAIIFLLLLGLELLYFKIAEHFNITATPNERSSHSTVVLCGGGIIFTLAAWIWAAFFGFNSIWFLLALTLAAGVSFIDDIHPLSDWIRLLVQSIAMVLLFVQLGLFSKFNPAAGLNYGILMPALVLFFVLIVCVGASNIINFMDGINGITGAYVMAALIPLYIMSQSVYFVNNSLIIVMALADIVFCIFNFRPKGKAKCFAGDVGSIGAAYYLLFPICCLILKSEDVTWLILLVVYGIDGGLTIIHRMMLHEDLGKAHRKHAYQIMANELHIGHVKISTFYGLLQLAISLGFIYLCPVLAAGSNLDLVDWHWIYLLCTIVILSLAYVIFMKKYYHLHEEYLASLK